MVDARKGMTEVRQMKKEGYTLNMLVAIICEVVLKHRNGVKLTQVEEFYAGLRFSEFLAVEDTPEAYNLADVKRQEYLKVLGTTPKEINELCLQYAKIR